MFSHLSWLLPGGWDRKIWRGKLGSIEVGSSDRKMNLETEIPVMTHCKEPALTSKMTLTFFESVKGLILY